MNAPLDAASLDTLFRHARSYNRWSPEPVPSTMLHALYECLKFGPTASNSSPARFIFVASPEAKRKLVGCVSPSNIVKVEQAPVTVIIGMDRAFHEKMPYLWPQSPGAADALATNPALAATVMLRNSSLQGAYLILAARALGLDCGPMSGFDNSKLDAAFFAGTPIESNFICALGAGTQERLRPRGPRLSFDEACRIL